MRKQKLSERDKSKMAREEWTGYSNKHKLWVGHTCCPFWLCHSLARLQISKSLFLILLNRILIRLDNSYDLSTRLSAFHCKKNFFKLRYFKVSWFRYMGNILFHYSILLMDVFNILPMGLDVLEKNGIVQQESVKKTEVHDCDNN